MSGDPAVRLETVSKAYGRRVAVDGLSLTVPTGSIYGFLGPNGAGKTTTMRLITGILGPDAGRVEVLGGRAPAQVRERLGYLPEERGLYPKVRVLDQIAYFGALKGMSRPAAHARAAALLEQYGLGPQQRARCQDLSKGMAQKVQLLATLIHEPDLIVLDEPFSGLDPVNRDLMRDAILAHRDRGASVIFSTHVLEQAEAICDHVLLIDGGRKLVDGPTDRVRAAAGGAVHLRYDGDLAFLAGQPGVAGVNDSGRQAEVLLEEGADAQRLLAALVERGVRVSTFDVRQASLHQIFVRTVGRRGAAGEPAP